MTKTNLRTLEVVFMSATNTRGSKVKITDLLRSESISISYDYKFNNCMDIAIDYLEKELKIEILYTSESKKGYLLHTNNFDASIKK
jgi:hypothetical protein